MENTVYSEYKVYVDVEVRFDKYGHMFPSSLTWEDGSTYKIEKLVSMREGFSSKAGGRGDMYLVIIKNTACRLFFEREHKRFSGSVGRWFVSKNIH